MKVYFEHIYEYIGYLFYAIASEHGKLNAVTFDRLKNLVDQQWYPVVNGVTVETNLANYLQSAMRNAYDNSMTEGDAFALFKGYYDLHSLPFGKGLRNKIFATANMIASEFSGNGKKSDFIFSLEKMFELNPITLI